MLAVMLPVALAMMADGSFSVLTGMVIPFMVIVTVRAGGTIVIMFLAPDSILRKEFIFLCKDSSAHGPG